MLHCVFALSAGFVPTATKRHSAGILSARLSPGPYANVAAENIDDVEQRFRDMENAKISASVAATSAPVAATSATVAATSDTVAALMEKHSFPLGLAQRAVESAKTFPIRFWIVDNSGSMGIPDGQKLGKTSTGNFKMIETTRWQELSPA